MFNALKYTKKLVEVGFSKEQAETAMELGIEVMNENLASKKDLDLQRLALQSDIKDLTAELRGEMKDLTAELRGEIKELGTELRGEIKELREDMHKLQDRLTIRMGAMFAATIAILGSLKFL